MPHKCTNCGRTFADGSKEMLSGCPDCGGNKFQFQPSRSKVSPDETKASSSTGSNSNPATATDKPAATDDSTAAPNSTATDTQSEAGAVGRATNTVKGWVGSRRRSESTNSDRNRPSQSSRGQSARKQSGHKQSGHDSSTQPTRKQSAQSGGEQSVQPDGEQSVQSDDEQSVQPNGEQSVQPDGEQSADSKAESSEDRAQASARSEIVPENELPDRPDADGTGTVIKPPEDDQPSLDELRQELNSQFESIKVVEPGQYELNLMELYERDEYIIAMRENGRYVIQVPDSWTGPVDS